MFFTSCMRSCGVVGGFGGAATSGKERRKILQELSAVRMLQGKSSFSGEHEDAAGYAKLSATCGCPGGSLDSRTGKDLLSRVCASSNCDCSVRTSARMICGEHSIQAGAAAELS